MKNQSFINKRKLISLITIFTILLGAGICGSVVLFKLESKTVALSVKNSFDVTGVTTTDYSQINVYGESVNLEFSQFPTSINLVSTDSGEITTQSISDTATGGINVSEMPSGDFYIQLPTGEYISSSLTEDISFYTITRNGKHNLITITTTNNLLVISKEKAESSEKVDILIDAGHGGTDSGAVASDGTTEAELNLQLSTIIANQLTELGYNVAITRTDDTQPGECSENINAYCPGGRVSQSYEYQANLVISIHHNSGGATGFEVYSSIFSDHTLATLVRDNLLTVSSPSTLEPYTTTDATVTEISDGLYTKSMEDVEYSQSIIDYMYMIREVGALAMKSESADNYPNNQSTIGAEAILIEFGYMDDLSDLAHISDEDVMVEEATAVTTAIDSYLNI